ncbi:hypothetical protein CsSME_00022573 [Camellia sinensis var. sinensis]
MAGLGVDPAVGVEAHDDGVVKPSDEVNPMECNISDVQGVDHQQQILKGTLARDKSHLHDGHKLNIEEGGDNNKKGGLQDIVVSMNLHGRACEVGTRRDMRTLKPGSWLSDTPINLVVVQLTNRQRHLHNDGRHTDWFFPVYLSTLILNKDMQPLHHEHIVTSFFGHDRYTGAIDACQRIYMPFNYRGVHWLCVKIDMVDRVAYLFDSVPSNRPNKRKLNAAKILVQTMHDLLQLHFGNDYATDVRSFYRCMLDERPVQQLDDTFDCGMFVIKFMQQPDLSPGPHKFAPSVHHNLLVDIVMDVNNAKIAEYRECLHMSNATS